MDQEFTEFHRPVDTAEAMAQLGRDDVTARPLVFGARLPDSPFTGADAAVDLGRLGLDYIYQEADGVVRVGALATLQALVDSPILRDIAGGLLVQAAYDSAASGLRQIATVGGVVLQQPDAFPDDWRTGPSEIILALLVLDAELVFHSPNAEPTTVVLSDFLESGAGRVRGQLLLEARFLRPASAVGGALARVARTPRDQSIVAAAALVALQEGRVALVRLAISGAEPRPARLKQVEDMLAGQIPDDETLRSAAQAADRAAQPHDDYLGSAEYRRAMAGVLVRRAFREAQRQATSQ